MTTPLRSLTVAASLLIVLSAEARQAEDGVRLDRLWRDAGRVSDLDGRVLTLSALAARVEAPVWVMRVQAAWCGTCRWHAAWTPALSARYGARVAVIDVLVADEDNAPADEVAGARWRDRAGEAALILLADPSALAGAFHAPAPLPRVLVVDGRTSAVVAALANPDPDRLTDAIDRALPARAAPFSKPTLVDGRFTPDQWALIDGMRLPVAPPPDPTNRVADDPSAADLGFMLFFEKALSPLGIACSNCHNQDRLFAENQDRPSYGASLAKRNVPAPVLLDHARSLFWDGRADSVWGQAVVPIEDPGEMASDRLFVAHAVKDRYQPSYEALFGPLPDLGDRTRFPPQGRPGTTEWASMRADDREAVTRVLANVGKALAAFERRLRPARTAFDRYAAGELTALPPWEKDGLAAFLEAGCTQCHFGPRLSNDAFHNLRFPTARADGQPDPGRLAVLIDPADDEFSRYGRFSDAPTSPPRLPRVSDRALGAFRTPGLRGVTETMPYGHGGGFDTLRAVIDAHRTGGLPAGHPGTIGDAEPWAQGFDPALIPRIVRFLSGLGADVTP